MKKKTKKKSSRRKIVKIVYFTMIEGVQMSVKKKKKKKKKKKGRTCVLNISPTMIYLLIKTLISVVIIVETYLVNQYEIFTRLC